MSAECSGARWIGCNLHVAMPSVGGRFPSEQETGLGAVVMHGEGLDGFGGGAADEDLNFGVAFEQVNGDDRAGDT